MEEKYRNELKIPDAEAPGHSRARNFQKEPRQTSDATAKV